MTILRTKQAREFALKEVDLYPVISSEFCNGVHADQMLQCIADGGAKMVQLREKNISTRDLCVLAEKCRIITDRYNMLLLINDRIDVALAVEADGVHLGQSDLPLSLALQIAPELVLGVSTHSVEQAIETQNQGASYINIGPILPTQTKKTPVVPLGIDIVGEIASCLHIPFSCMGGIKSHHIPQLLDRGARMIAMVTEITQSVNPMERTRELRQLFRR